MSQKAAFPCLLAYCLALCVGLSFAQSKNNRRTLYYGDFGTPATFEPVTANKAVEHHLCQFVFDSLVVSRIEGDFAFSLARELEISPDGLSYTFILHDNLKWADKTSLTSKDVEFSIDLLLNSKKNSTLAKYIDEVICINPQAITITLKRPFFSPLALFTFKILPKHKFKTNSLDRSNPFVKKPLGCGPFKHRSHKKNSYTLKRNSQFSYRKRPFFKKVVAKIYDNKQQALKALLQKKVRLITEVSTADIPKLQRKQKQFALKRYSARTIYFIAINHRQQHRYHRLFHDVRFRRALLYSVDRRGILRTSFHAGINGKNGQAHRIITGPFPSNTWAYNDEVSPYPYDPDEGRLLLDKVLLENGYQLKDGFWRHPENGPLKLTLQCMKGDWEIESACSQLIAFWKNMGIEVALAIEDERKFDDRVFLQHDFDLVYTKYTFDNTINIFPLFDPARTGKGESNFAEYVDPKLRELFSRLHNSLDPWALRFVSHKIHRTVHDDAVHLFLWQLDIYAAHHRSLRNVEVHPHYLFNFPEKWKIVEE